jgi:CHAT domain-containing protein
LLQVKLFSNPALLAAEVLTTRLQLMLLYVAPIAQVFGTQPLDGNDLLLCSGFCRIPFAALPAPETLSAGPGPRWLAQVVRLRLITSGLDLLPKTRSAQVNAGQALVIANPEFGAPGTPWAPLRATASEGQEIAAQFKATQLTGSQPTAPALHRIKGPRVLLVASHGFFSDPQPSAQPAALGPLRPGSRGGVLSAPQVSMGDPC